MQPELFRTSGRGRLSPPKGQLLKWIGNKQRFAEEIVSYFPRDFRTYIEPFLGSAAVLATLAPEKAVGSDSFAPLIEIWLTLKTSPETVKRWYAERWRVFTKGVKRTEFERIKARYNSAPNGADLLFISRACYGGVIRFRQLDGHISTPVGAHNPISPESFAERVDEWQSRISRTTFICSDYRPILDRAGQGDLVYCDPPYTHSQSILYGAQKFNIIELLRTIEECKSKGARVALSIDGKKKSGQYICDVPIPPKLFKREIYIHCGRSMLKRFQMQNKSLENEAVADRLLLTF